MAWSGAGFWCGTPSSHAIRGHALNNPAEPTLARDHRRRPADSLTSNAVCRALFYRLGRKLTYIRDEVSQLTPGSSAVQSHIQPFHSPNRCEGSERTERTERTVLTASNQISTTQLLTALLNCSRLLGIDRLLQPWDETNDGRFCLSSYGPFLPRRVLTPRLTCSVKDRSRNPDTI